MKKDKITCDKPDKNGHSKTYLNGEKTNVKMLIFDKEQSEKLMDIADSINRSQEKVINGENLFFKYHFSDGFKWLRFRLLNDWGIHLKNINKYPPLFSERNGYQKYITIGKWRIKILKPFS